MISSWGVPGGAIVHPISMLRIAGTVREGFSGDCEQITSGQWSLIDSDRVCQSRDTSEVRQIVLDGCIQNMTVV